MSTVEITKRMAEGSPNFRSKVVLGYYLLSIVTGTFFFFARGRVAFAVDAVLAVLYLVATGVFYSICVGRESRRRDNRSAAQGS